MFTDARSLLEEFDALSSGARSHLASSLVNIIATVLAKEGYTRTPAVPYDSVDPTRFDLVVGRPADSRTVEQRVGVEVKDPNQPMETYDVRRAVGAALLTVDRALLISTAGFTDSAHEIIGRELPLSIELFDLSRLRKWIASLEAHESPSGVREAVRVLSRKLAEIIARDPRELFELDWRDLERTIAEVLHAIGFEVELTPAAKDGGKDVVATCRVRGVAETHILEIKHWKSKKAGEVVVTKFLEVIAREERAGGLLLATAGYAPSAFRQITEIQRQNLRFGSSEKVVSLCRAYTKVSSGLWTPPEHLPEVLYEETVTGTRDHDA